MKSNRAFEFAYFLALLTLAACGGARSGTATTGGGCTNASGPVAIPTSSTNTIPIYIADPSSTGSNGYTNEPLVSVTICTPNHTSASQCQTISNVLLDTGSYGLRLFASTINSNVQLTQQTITAQSTTLNLAECMSFGTGTTWGSVKNADIILGNQTATNTPIQVVDMNYASIPSGSACDGTADPDPCTMGFNGILGVGPFAQDCGTDCDSTNKNVNFGIYFGCNGSACGNYYSGACLHSVCMIQVANSQQVTNPIANFGASFNNGFSLTLPNVSSSGSSEVVGSATLGIPNTATAAAVYPSDANGMTDGNLIDFNVTYNATTYGFSGTCLAFLDSGSNGIFFPAAFVQCSDGSGFYCPGSTQTFNVTIAGYLNNPSNASSLSIANAFNLFNSGHTAFNDIGGYGDDFDLGLPFFFNRTIYVGLSGTSAMINASSSTGPYWAF